MEQITFKTKNINARVCTWGDKDNPTIICLHGLGSTNLSFLEVGELLKDKYYIVSIELPGHGKTPAFDNDEDYAVPNLISWLSSIINQFEKERFFIMAHSWGGCIALHYAALYPKKVRKMLLIDGGYHQKQDIYDYFSNVDREKLNFHPNCSLAEEIAEYKADFDGYVFSNWNDFLAVEKENYARWSPLLEQASMDLMKEDTDGTIRFCASGETARKSIISMYNYPTSLIYDRLKTQILLLQSTLPESCNEIRTILVDDFQKHTNCIVKRIAASHLIHWDNPLLVANIAKEWLK